MRANPTTNREHFLDKTSARQPSATEWFDLKAVLHILGTLAIDVLKWTVAYLGVGLLLILFSLFAN